MKRSAKEFKKLAKKIKVQLDEKTIVIINKIESFQVWKRKFPNAKIIK